MKKLFLVVASALCLCAAASAQSYEGGVLFTVNAKDKIEPMKPLWAWVGYDEPNYTYMKDGVKLLTELSELSPVPVSVRAHNLLTSGDGSASLKWGSTNAYTEDSKGRPVYDWTILDRIFDTYLQRGIKPFVEIGFMPEALSTKPEPYRHSWAAVNSGPLWTGWTYPAKDYDKWRELVYQWVRHCIDRYGREEVLTWYWEVWNEPDIGYWSGTHEEYCKLYDYAVDGVKKALPEAKVGGPETTDPSGQRANEYLRKFLDHCRDGVNCATGKKGAPLDFITFHAKGSPQFVDGHVRMNIGRQLKNIDMGCEVVASYPEFKHLPIIIGESDPEGCAACSVATHPSNAYRNGTMYSSYSANTWARTYEIARKHGVNIVGAVAWAFEYEDQIWFGGFRDLATNGVDKPVLNVMRMYGLMQGGSLVRVGSSNPMTADQIIADSVRERSDISAIANATDNSVSIMVWNYHDDDLPAPATEVTVNFDNLGADRVLVSHYRIDGQFSNSYEAWKGIGSPQRPTPEQVAYLEQSGQLQAYTSPAWKDAPSGRLDVNFTLPRQGVSLIKITW